MQLKWPMLWDLFSLFPAYAGVILHDIETLVLIDAFPRIRGGDPWLKTKIKEYQAFSPHTRG